MARPLRFKLIVPLITVILALALFVNILVIRGFKKFYFDSLVETEQKEIALVIAALPESLLVAEPGRALQDYCLFVDRHLRQRVTFIDTSGRVLGDSRVLYDTLPRLENHRLRPEIRSLSTAPFAHAVRTSATLKIRMLYLAAPVVRDGQLKGYLRFAIPLNAAEEYLHRRALGVIAVTLIAFLLVALFIYRFSGRIHKVVVEIGARAKRVESGQVLEKLHFGFSRETDLLYDSLEDTSERLQALIADLTAQKEEVAVLLRSVSEAVIAVDDRDNVRFANDNACRLFDSPFTPDTLPVLPLTGFTHDPAFLEITRETFRTRNSLERTVPFKNQHRSFELRATCSPVARPRATGEIVALLTLVNVTEEKQLTRTKAEFVEAASHELRTPLTILKGYIETLELAPDETMRRQSFERIKNSIVRLENLTHDLLQLSYLESGKVSMQYADTDPGRLTNEILSELRPLLNEKGISVAVECGPAFRSVPELVHILLYNLIQNAVKYNRTGGRIRVRSSLKDGYNILEVLDTGIGIPHVHRDKVFERFYRIDRDRSRVSGGTGLGLAIVKHIASVLGGTVRVTDGLEGGAGFVMTLPVH